MWKGNGSDDTCGGLTRTASVEGCRPTIHPRIDRVGVRAADSEMGILRVAQDDSERHLLIQTSATSNNGFQLCREKDAVHFVLDEPILVMQGRFFLDEASL